MVKAPTKLTVETLKHDDATRKNIPTAEFQSVMRRDEQDPVRPAYERRNRDLDPQCRYPFSPLRPPFSGTTFSLRPIFLAYPAWPGYRH